MTTTAFIDVTVVPMDGERVIEGQTVLVEGDRIAAIGPTREIDVPNAATRTDGRGRYLMPGLCDMHVHYNEASFAPLFVAHGVTTVRNMWGFPFHVRARDAIRAGADVVGPAIYTCGPIMDGNPPIWPGSAVIETAEDAARSVAEQKEQGYDFLKVYSNLSPEAYDAITAAARTHAMRVVGHVSDRVGLRHALESGQASIEHLQGYLPALLADGAPAANARTYTARMLHVAEHADESKIQPCVEWTLRAEAWMRYHPRQPQDGGGTAEVR